MTGSTTQWTARWQWHDVDTWFSKCTDVCVWQVWRHFQLLISRQTFSWFSNVFDWIGPAIWGRNVIRVGTSQARAGWLCLWPCLWHWAWLTSIINPKVLREKDGWTSTLSTFGRYLHNYTTATQWASSTATQPFISGTPLQLVIGDTNIKKQKQSWATPLLQVETVPVTAYCWEPAVTLHQHCFGSMVPCSRPTAFSVLVMLLRDGLYWWQCVDAKVSESDIVRKRNNENIGDRTVKELSKAQKYHTVPYVYQ